MTNNRNNQNDGDEARKPEHAIATSPQDLLNFLGFISKGTLIGAVTAAAIKDDLTKLVKALDAGQTDEAKEHADQIRQGLNLLGKAVCTLGQTIVRHDEYITRKCEERGIPVTSVSENLIDDFKLSGEAFLKSFFEEAKGNGFVEDPEGPFKKNPKPSADKPKQTDRKPGPDFGPHDRFDPNDNKFN
ncbi:MAG: hypothetical protein ACO29V_05960 [Limnohabitans sp.]